MVDDFHQSVSSPVKNGSTPRATTSPHSSLLTFTAYASVVIASMVFIVYYARNLEHFLEYIKHLDALGNIIFILSYFPAGLPFAFVSYYIPLSLSAGYTYGAFRGFVTAMAGSVSSGIFGFWVTRTFCRAWIEEKIQSSARLSALLMAMEMHSFKVTLMLRFLPLPFGLQNGLCAMTSITTPMFWLSSTIGLLPENILLIYFGTSVQSISEGVGSISVVEKVLLGGAVLVTGIVVILGRKMLDVTLAMARSSNKKTEDIELLGSEDAKLAGRNGGEDLGLDRNNFVGGEIAENTLKTSKISINILPDPPPPKHSREEKKK